MLCIWHDLLPQFLFFLLSFLHIILHGIRALWALSISQLQSFLKDLERESFTVSSFITVSIVCSVEIKVGPSSDHPANTDDHHHQGRPYSLGILVIFSEFISHLR